MVLLKGNFNPGDLINMLLDLEIMTAAVIAIMLAITLWSTSRYGFLREFKRLKKLEYGSLMVDIVTLRLEPTPEELHSAVGRHKLPTMKRNELEAFLTFLAQHENKQVRDLLRKYLFVPNDHAPSAKMLSWSTKPTEVYDTSIGIPVVVVYHDLPQK